MKKILSIFLLLFSPCSIFSIYGQEKDALKEKNDTIPPQNQENRFLKPYKPSKQPIYNFQDNYSTPFIDDNNKQSPFLLKKPKSLNQEISIDDDLEITTQEKLGKIKYRPPEISNFNNLDDNNNEIMIKSYLRRRSLGDDSKDSHVDDRRLIPPIYISPVFDRIFGGSRIDIIPTGYVALDFSTRLQRVYNNTSIRQQESITPIQFDQQISLNVKGKIGDKLQITTNFDNNNNFNFENNFKVVYTGYPEDIIKKIEIGNVSLPLNNSLITGFSNLFGLKTQLQFGKFYLTTVASTQRGQSNNVVVSGSGGGKAKKIEIQASSYEENNHFFLAHFFRDNYEKWLENLPNVASQVQISKLEVYIINRSNNTKNLRNILALMDLAETDKAYRKGSGYPKINLSTNPTPLPADNQANALFRNLINDPQVRNSNTVLDALQSNYGLVNGTDFVLINSAKQLTQKEYYFNEKLGYLSLYRQLQNDEALAVSFTYSYKGELFQVGELSQDYGQRGDDDVIFLKMLRPSKNNILDVNDEVIPSWNLMMKNVYSLRSGNISQNNFKLEIVYRDDRTGIDNPSLHEGQNTKNIPLIRLMGLDRLNVNGDPQPDGNFDWVDDITIKKQRGIIFFPVLEPFGSGIVKHFEGDPDVISLTTKYAFSPLYTSTKSDAERMALLNKYYLVGEVLSGAGSEVRLSGINIAKGSVKVTAGNTPLTEGTDYTVDYNFGRVKIINESITNSGKDINISYEKADLFSIQTKTLLGNRLEYKLNDQINFASTFLYLWERPLVSRIAVGNEPIENVKIGFDVNYKQDSRILTRVIDAFPLISTKEKSVVSFSGEFAQLYPGTSNEVQGVSTVYIDDFEGSSSPYSLGGGSRAWKLSSIPQTLNHTFDPSEGASRDLSAYNKRAKLSWFVIDNIFYNSGLGSGSVTSPPVGNEDKVDNHYTRPVNPSEVYPQQDQEVGTINLNILNLAYFPSERGQYNYNPALATNDGLLPNPEENFGGIMRAINREVDFDKSNIEFLEFWLLDPFIQGRNGVVKDGILNQNNISGGELVFNLGSISEDMVRDNQHNFENGLPPDGSDAKVALTPLGRVGTEQFVVNAFSNIGGSRANQDVGLDGLPNQRENDFEPYQDFKNAINAANINLERKNDILNDLSNDNFLHYLDNNYTAQNKGILERYKKYNGMENNSPIAGDQDVIPANTNSPDNEDINRDNTISSIEEYYDYRVSLKPDQMVVGKNYITDKVTSNVNGESVDWFLFRIPVRKPTNKFGNISDFKTIKFFRTYLTGWSQPVVLRFAKIQLVGSQWIRYTDNLYDKGFFEPTENTETTFVVSTINIEENAQGSADHIRYVEPPGIERDLDITAVNLRRQNEQSLKMDIENLADKDARAAYKNINLDLINYGRIKMFLHAEGKNVSDGEMSAFLRLGNDFNQNYYEIEIPLKITSLGATDAYDIWPEDNNIDFVLDDLLNLKVQRNNSNASIELPFVRQIGKYKTTLKGNPELNNVKVAMIGVRNPKSDDATPKSITIWANELRVSDFNSTAGWATNSRMNVKLADFADMTTSFKYVSAGFGSIQQKNYERTRDTDFSYDVSATINLDKLVPAKVGLKVPMYVSYEKTIKTPLYDPLNPDVRLETSLSNLSGQEKIDYESITLDQTTRKSINFSNVKKVKMNLKKPSRIYDISNLSFTYSWSEQIRTSFSLQEYNNTNIKGAINYNFSPKSKYIEPFKSSRLFTNPYLKFIKDFNFSLIPNNLIFRAELNKNFAKTQKRNEDLTTINIAPTYIKSFVFYKNYALQWNLTKKLRFNFDASVEAIIDEPEGEIDTQEKKDIIYNNILKLGRMKNYKHMLKGTYTLPLDKFPILQFIRSQVVYTAGYNWSATALNQQTTIGHTVNNNNNIKINGKIDLLKLYNQSKFLKRVNTPLLKKKNKTKKKIKTPEKGENKGNENQEDKNKKDKENNEIPKFTRGLMRVLMSIRSINFDYKIDAKTSLPGYLPTPYILGANNGFSAPTTAFLLGDQSSSIKNTAAENGWLVKNPLQSNNFNQSNTITYNVGAIVEPFRDFRIMLKAKKRKNNIYTEIFRTSTENPNVFNSFNPSRSGAYSVTGITFLTAFESLDQNYDTPTYKKFQENRQIILDRLERINTGSGTYNINSQQVLIPAFLATYSGADINKVSFSPFTDIPLPNWNISYSGLSKIPAIKKNLKSLTLTHGYSSTFDIRSFTSSNLYTNSFTLNNSIENYRPESVVSDNSSENYYTPVYVINAVTITESFSPLIGLSVTTKNRMTFSFNYKKTRNISLNLANSQITEQRKETYSLTFAYTNKNFRLPIKSRGSWIVLKNNISFKLQSSIGNGITVQRKIGDVNTPTQGSLDFQIKPSIDYMLNRQLNLQVYYSYTLNEPVVQIIPKRTNTIIGFKLRFNLTQ